MAFDLCKHETVKMVMKKAAKTGIVSKDLHLKKTYLLTLFEKCQAITRLRLCKLFDVIGRHHRWYWYYLPVVHHTGTVTAS